MASTEAEFLEAIDLVRADYGACTYDALARQLGVTRTSVYDRVQRLVARGLVTVSELPGSIRRVVSEESSVGGPERR